MPGPAFLSRAILHSASVLAALLLPPRMPAAVVSDAAPAAPETTALGEQPAATLKALSWRTGAFARGNGTLTGSIQLIPAAHATELLLKLQRIIPSANSATSNRETIAATFAFIRARSPIWSRNLAIEVPFTFDIPEDLPDGQYRIEASNATPSLVLSGATTHDFSRGPVKKPVPAISLIASPGETPLDWQLALSHPIGAPSRVEAWLFIPNSAAGVIPRLAATASYPVDGDATRLVVRLPDTPRWRSALAAATSENSVTLQFHIGATTAIATIPLRPLPLSSSALPDANYKSIAHGAYEQPGGVRHYWHADDDHSLHWNGMPWTPFGGMFYIFPPKNTLRERAAERTAIARQLDTLQAAGFRDLYVNAGVGQTAPEWFTQTVVDEFNRRGIPFGWQLTTGAKPYAAWMIYSSTSQGLIRARASVTGKLEAEIPQVPTTELLIVPANGTDRARRIPFAFSTATSDRGMEIAQILESANTSSKKQLITLDIPGLPAGDYYVIINAIQRGKRLSNVWERLDETKSGLDWITRIDWGPGLRFFVDPVCNEGGINNHDEPLRVSSSSFDIDYSKWLQNRYANNLSSLSSSWSLSSASRPVDFVQAARLIPLRDLDTPRYKKQNNITLVDPETGALFHTAVNEGASWMDYLAAVREIHASKLDEIARYLKARVNVPVVIKRVSPWVSTEGIARTPGGIDGIGLELYPESGSGVPYGGLSGRAEADLSVQTTWLLATELGYSAKPGNRDIKSWPDKETFERIVRETVSTGAKGIYLFGWRLPGREWTNHILLDQPDRLQWAREIAQNLTTNPPPVWKTYGLIFPEGQSWWWYSNRKPWTRYTSVYSNPPSVFPQSARLLGDGSSALWAVSSSVPIPEANPIVINLADPYFALHYTKDIDRLIDSGKHIIYLGQWPAGASTPARLARHFSSARSIPLPGGNGEFQPLQIHAGDEILAKDANGNAWAKLNTRERLLIVSATPAVPAVKNSDQLPRHLNPAWVSRLLSHP